MKIGTEALFLSLVYYDEIIPNLICADCYYNECEHCRWGPYCTHTHYYKLWGSKEEMEGVQANAAEQAKEEEAKLSRYESAGMREDSGWESEPDLLTAPKLGWEIFPQGT